MAAAEEVVSEVVLLAAVSEAAAVALAAALVEMVVAVVAKEVRQEMVAMVVVATGMTGKVAQLVEMVSIPGAIGNQNHHRLHLHPPSLSQSQQPHSLLRPLPQFRRRPFARRPPFLLPLPFLNLFQLKRRVIPGPIGQPPAHPFHHHRLPQLRSRLQPLTFLPHQLLKLLIGLTGRPLHLPQSHLLQLRLSLWSLLSGLSGRHLWRQLRFQLRPLAIIGRTGAVSQCRRQQLLLHLLQCQSPALHLHHQPR